MKKKIWLSLGLIILVISVMAIVLAGCSGEGSEQLGEHYMVGYSKVDVNPWIRDYPGKDNMTDANGNPIGVVYDSDWTDATTQIKFANVTSPKQTSIPFVGVRISGFGSIADTFSDSVIDDNCDGKVGQGDGLFSTVTTVTDTTGKTVIFITIDSIGGYPQLLQPLKTAIVQQLKGAVTADNIILSASHAHSAVDMIYCSSAAKGTAVRAYFDYYVSTITNAAVSAYENRQPATMSKGAIDASDASGFQLNFVRHYITGEVENDQFLVTGSNFGPSSALKMGHVSEADDMMYLLQFTPVKGGAPIVLVNWRAHATFIGTSTSTILSSDYIGPLRHYMEEAGYRVAFWQGGAGNIVPSSSIFTDNKWKSVGLSDFTYQSSNSKLQECARYGFLLTKVAKKCLSNNMQELSEGNIRTTKSMFVTARQTDSEGLKAAVVYWRDVLGSPKNKGDATKNGGTFGGWPLVYTWPTDNQKYVLSSYFHADMMRGRLTATGNNAGIEINAIMLGNSVAMVTSGNELFDRYSLTNTLDDTSDNDWLELVNESTYGTPFVLAYTSGGHAYMPNKLAYEYNSGSVMYSVGSYESNTCAYAPGSGEALIQEYKKMLTSLASN